MERVGKYHGVRLRDAIKFAWMDATFAVEGKMDKLHRNRVQRASLKTNVAAEASTYVDHGASTTITTENVTQEAPATTDNPQKKPWEYH